MLWWLVDNATICYVILGLSAIGIGAAWWMRRTRPLLIALGVAMALIVVVWLLTLFIVTDRMRLRAAIEELAAGVTNNQPERTVKHLARDFEFGAVKKENAAQKIGSAIRHYQIAEITTGEPDFETLNRAARSARVSFRTWVTLTGQRHPFRVQGDFVLEDEQWRLKSFVVYPPVGDTPIRVGVP